MWYRIFRTLCVVVLKLFFRLKVEGLENIPKKNNFIVVANHASFLDPLVIAAAVPRKIHCITSRFIYRVPFLNLLLRKLEVLPTGGISEKAIEYVLNGRVVGLFPEGGCSRDGKLREFRKGAALLGFRTGRPVVPCAILGTYSALPLKAKFPKFLPIKVKIGKPIFFLKEFDEIIDDIELQEGTARIKRATEEMIYAG